MRLLGLNNTYPPSGRGGYAEICSDVMSGLARAGHDVTMLVCRDPSREPGPATWDGVEVRYELAEVLAAWRRPRRARTAVRNDRAAVRRALERGVDACVVWHLRGVVKPPVRLLHEAGIPVLYMLHDRWVLYERPGSVLVPWARAEPVAWRLLGEPPVARDGVVCFNSRWLADEHARLGWTARDPQVIPCGLPDRMLDVPAAERPEGGADRLLFAGRLDPSKGVGDAIEALALLDPAVTLAIAGPATVSGYGETLRRRAEDLGVADRVSWLGELSRPELVEAFGRHDILVYPSREPESFGLGILEGQAAGLVAVTSAPGGPREFLADGRNCLLHEPGDPEGLAAAIRRLRGDPGLTARLRDQGRRTAAAMPVDAVVAQVEGLITSRAGGA